MRQVRVRVRWGVRVRVRVRVGGGVEGSASDGDAVTYKIYKSICRRMELAESS